MDPQSYGESPAASTPGGGRRERKKRELRARIYGSARQLFLEQGFEATTVEQIASAADVAPATFFNHFQSKNGLLREMTGEVFAHIDALVETYLLAPGTTRQRIAAFVGRAASDIADARELAHDVVMELIATSARPGELLPYLSRVREPFTAVIRLGQAAGEVRDDAGVDFLAEMVVGALNAAVVNWVNDSDYPLETRLRQAAAFICDAIEPRGRSTRDPMPPIPEGGLH
jgi:AcrR family transcriptional regulator